MDSEGIDSATEHFTNILNDICACSLRLACTQKKPKKQKIMV